MTKKRVNKEEVERLLKKKDTLFLGFDNFEDLYTICTLTSYIKSYKPFDTLSFFKKLNPEATQYEINIYENIAILIDNIYMCRFPNKDKKGNPNFNNFGMEMKDMLPKIRSILSNILPF